MPSCICICICRGVNLVEWSFCVHFYFLWALVKLLVERCHHLFVFAIVFSWTIVNPSKSSDRKNKKYFMSCVTNYADDYQWGDHWWGKWKEFANFSEIFFIRFHWLIAFPTWILEILAHIKRNTKYQTLPKCAKSPIMQISWSLSGEISVENQTPNQSFAPPCDMQFWIFIMWSPNDQV